jgi:chromosomal replication initiation ATPase DnaA
MAMYLCQRMGGLNLNEIANHFQMKHYASVSKQIREVKDTPGAQQLASLARKCCYSRYSAD